MKRGRKTIEKKVALSYICMWYDDVCMYVLYSHDNETIKMDIEDSFFPYLGLVTLLPISLYGLPPFVKAS